MFFPHVRNFTLIYGPYRYLIHVLFGPIWWQIIFVFSNARSILKLMLCNRSITKLDILTLLSCDCRAWALKLIKHIKKQTNHVFCLHFPNSNFRIIFLHFLFIFFLFFNISYPNFSLNLCYEYNFLTIRNCHKSSKNLDFSEKFDFPWNQLDAFVFVFFPRTQNQRGITK